MAAPEQHQAPTRWPVTDASSIVREHLSAEQFSSCCDQRWSTDRRSSLPTDKTTRPRLGDIVYAKQDHVDVLFRGLRKSRERVVLVTAESDVPVLPRAEFPPQVAAWFATNATCKGVEALPLGLGNSYCPVTTKADVLASVAGAPKTGLLYANFRVETNPARRAPLLDKFRASAWCGSVTFPSPGLLAEHYARDLASHRFALCPAGNGTDTHRMWEALYVGTVPVVERHEALEAFRDLPILFVEDFRLLEPGFLASRYERILEASWNCAKLFLPWWRSRFEEASSRIRSRVPWAHYLPDRLRQGLRRGAEAGRTA